MAKKSVLKRIKAEFDTHNMAMIEREIRRLESRGEIEFDASKYSISPNDFISEISHHCIVDEREVLEGDFLEWYSKNNYKEIFPDYCKTYTDENLLRKKAFEHWLSIQETKLAPPGIFLDVGCATSPFHRLWSEMDDSPAEKVYRVDLPLPEYGFKPGVNGNIVGCTADNIPLDDESVARIYSHNAIEHFEGGSFTGLFKESARLLSPGGVLLFCPLFVARETFTFVSLTGIYRRLHFPDIPIGTKIVYSDKVGQPYSLFIDSDYLLNRIIAPLADVLTFKIVRYIGSAAKKYGVELSVQATKK